MLSNAELRVKELVTKGWSNGDVAKELALTQQTIKFHLTNIYKKLGVSSRSELIAQELGGTFIKEREIVVSNLDQKSRQVEIVPKSQEEKIQFIDDKFHVGNTIDQLHGMMKEVTKDQINPSTVNAACNCVARLNETINTAITAARFLNER
jgi:DNA-binding CsgD family transcriptional regulator